MNGKEKGYDSFFTEKDDFTQIAAYVEEDKEDMDKTKENKQSVIIEELELFKDAFVHFSMSFFHSAVNINVKDICTRNKKRTGKAEDGGENGVGLVGCHIGVFNSLSALC